MSRLREAPELPGYAAQPACIHVDTNLLIQATGNAAACGPLRAWLASGGVCAASAMAWAEFRCGSSGGLADEDVRLARVLVTDIIALDETIATRAAELFIQGGRRSRSLADCLIAATAILAGVPLATGNRADFERYVPAGLQLW